MPAYSSPQSRRRRSLSPRVSVILLIASATASCDRQTTGPADDLIPQMGKPESRVELQIEVTRAEGTDKTLLPGAGVWIYGNGGSVVAGSPFYDADDGHSDGVIKISLPEGSYGALLTGVPKRASTLKRIAPLEPVPTADVEKQLDFSPLARLETWACATPENILATKTDRPILVTKQSPPGPVVETVDVDLCTSHKISLDIPGAADNVVVYGAINALGKGLINDVPAGFFPAVISYVALVKNGKAELLCPAGSLFLAEILQNAAVSKVGSFPVVQANGEPGVFLCGAAQSSIEVGAAQCEPDRDPAFGADPAEFDDPVFKYAQFGYAFKPGNPELGEWSKLRDLSVASARIGIRDVPGDYKVTFRTDLPDGSRLQTERTITVPSGLASKQPRSTGKGNPQQLVLTYRTGVIEAVLSGIPDHTVVTFFVSGPNGSGLPPTSRSSAFAGYYPIPAIVGDPVGEDLFPNQTCHLGESPDPGLWNGR